MNQWEKQRQYTFDSVSAMIDYAESKNKDHESKKFQDALWEWVEEQEVEIHKWIESEKANRDLGEEAIKDWIIKHAAEFRKKWEEENSQKDEK